MNLIAARYLFFYLTKVIASIALIIITLFTVLNLLESLGDTQRSGLVALLVDVALKLPEIVYLVLPATCAVGAVIGVALLDSRGEIVLLRTMGISIGRLLRWLAVCASVWVLLHVLVGELLLANSAVTARKIETARSGSFIASGEEIWLRTNSGFASVGLISPDSQLLRNVWIYEAPGDADLTKVVFARSASFRDDYWLLEQVREARIVEGNWQFRELPNEPWLEGPSQRLLEALAIEPRFLPVTRLLEIMDELAELGQNTLSYELILWSRIADSLTIFVLVLAGLLAVVRRTRASAATPRVAGAVALLLMFFYYYGSVVIRQVSLEENWPAIIGATLPVVLLCSGLFVWMKLAARHR